MQFSQSSSALPSYMDPQLRMAMPPPPPPIAAAGLGSTTQSTYSTTGGNIWDSKPYQYNMPWTDRGGHETMDNRSHHLQFALFLNANASLLFRYGV